MLKEIKSIIVSTKVLNELADQQQQAIQQKMNHAIENQKTSQQLLLDQLMKQTNFVRDSTLFVNVYRTKINKNSPLFRLEECPFGFGYYSVF